MFASAFTAAPLLPLSFNLNGHSASAGDIAMRSVIPMSLTSFRRSGLSGRKFYHETVLNIFVYL